MQKNIVIFELTDMEIRAFCIEFPPTGKHKQNKATCKFEQIQIPTGVIEQGNIRDNVVIVDLLEKYHKQLQGKGYDGYLAIPLQQGFVREYSLPWLSKPDRKPAVSLLVEEEVPIPSSDLLYDYRVISEESSKNLRIILGAFRESLLIQYVEIFKSAGFKIIGVDFSFHVLGQALGFEEKEDTLVLLKRADNLQMVLFRGSVPDRERTLSNLTSVELYEGHNTTWLEQCEKEIRHFLLYYRAQKSNYTLNRLVWCGNAIVKELALSLKTANTISLVQKAKFKNVPSSWQRVLEENEGSSEVVIGYGLCVLANSQQLNLWRQSKEEDTRQKRYRVMASFALLVVIIGNVSWFSIIQQQLSVEQEVQILSKKGASLVEKIKHETELNNTWNKVKAESNKVGFNLEQIQALSRPQLQIEQMQYKQEMLTIRGSGTDSKSVQSFIRSIAELGWEKPVLLSYQLNATSEVQFSLSTKLKNIATRAENTTEK